MKAAATNPSVATAWVKRESKETATAPLVEVPAVLLVTAEALPVNVGAWVVVMRDELEPPALAPEPPGEPAPEAPEPEGDVTAGAALLEAAAEDTGLEETASETMVEEVAGAADAELADDEGVLP